MWPSVSRKTGRSDGTPSMGLVTMYMCSQAWSGTVTPLSRPSSRAHMPAQLTRISVAMTPSEVSTRAPRAGASREGLSDVGGIRLAVARNPHCAHEVVGAHERVALARLLGADHLGLDAEGAREGRVALELHHALGCPRHADAAAAPPPRGLARFHLQAAIQIRAIANELGQVAGGAELADEPGRVPRGPAEKTHLL